MTDYKKQADKIIESKNWALDNQGFLVNQVITLLMRAGMTESQAYEYLELQ